MKRERTSSSSDAVVRAATQRETDPRIHSEELLHPLPSLLVREHVFSFLAAPALLTGEELDHRSFAADLQPLRSVCQSWKEIADALEDDAIVAHYRLDITRGDRDEIEQLQRHADAKSTHVKNLEITMGSIDARVFACCRYPSLDETTLCQFPWLSLLSKYQHVVRLDLSLVLWSQLPQILAVASRVCVHVQGLVLPFRPLASEMDQYQESELTPVLTDALRKWHAHDDGLRLLHIPFWPSDPHTTRHTDLLAAITTYCPRLKRLRGSHAGSDVHAVTALGNVRLDVWSDLWHNCSELREFSWRMAPMAGNHLSIFLQQPRPWLEAMVIDEHRGRSNMKFAIETVTSMLNVTPALRSLKLRMHDTLFFLLAENHSAYAGVIDTLADAFVSDVVAKCPKLEQLHYTMRSPERMLALTGAGISTLVALPSIRELALTRVVFEVTSLKALVQKLSKSQAKIKANAKEKTRIRPRKYRELSIALTAADAAHDSLLALLEYLSTSAPVFLDGLALSLSVVREEMVRTTHPRGIRVKNLISEEQLQQLLDGIETTYGTTRDLETTTCRLRLQVYSFGVGVPRYAMSEIQLQFNGAVDAQEESDASVGSQGRRRVCDVERIQVLRHRKRGGMIA